MKHKLNQAGFHILSLLFGLVVLSLIISAGIYVHSRSNSSKTNSQTTGRTSYQTNNAMNQQKLKLTISAKDVASLPNISYFQTHKTDQFIVDMSLVQSGFPYKGTRSVLPHNGAHVQFGNDYNNWPQGGTAAENYPAVYSPVDGYVTEINDHFSDYSKNPVDLYAISIAFAKSGTSPWTFGYSLEPFVKEPSPGFYDKFIDVKVGQKVHKGQVIAHMYLSKDGGSGEHIHFSINKTGSGQSYPPVIFSNAIVQDFYNHWGSFGVDDEHNDPSGTKIPVCMGYKLSANENPFGVVSVDCLN